VSWKPITDQLVVAHLDGKVRQVVVTAWESHSGAIRVDWPHQNPATASSNPYARVGKRQIEKSRYEPLDPEGFRAATTG